MRHLAQLQQSQTTDKFLSNNSNATAAIYMNKNNAKQPSQPLNPDKKGNPQRVFKQQNPDGVPRWAGD
jgi:hypothetical protein